MTVGEKRPRSPPPRVRARVGDGGILRQPHHFERAGAMRQAADEAALLQPADQAVDARFGFEAQRLLHFLEGGRNAAFGKPPVDEDQQLVLLSCQHRHAPRRRPGRSEQNRKPGGCSSLVPQAPVKRVSSRQNRRVEVCERVRGDDLDPVAGFGGAARGAGGRPGSRPPPAATSSSCPACRRARPRARRRRRGASVARR